MEDTFKFFLISVIVSGSRQLPIHQNASSSIAFHLKNHSVPKLKFRKIPVENTSIIAHEIDKVRQQIQVAQLLKQTKKLLELILKIATMFWNAFSFSPYYYVFYFRW